MALRHEKSLEEVMAKSFKTLATQKPIEKITIKEITDLSGVIRPTFYNHFQDKYDLLEWIVKNELVAPANSVLLEKDTDSGILEFFATIEKDKEFYKSCVKLEGQNSFPDILRRSLSEQVLSYVDEKAVAKRISFEWLTPWRLGEFFSESITFVAIGWVKEDFSIPKEEIAACIKFLVNNSLIDFIKG